MKEKKVLTATAEKNPYLDQLNGAEEREREKEGGREGEREAKSGCSVILNARQESPSTDLV